MATDIFAIVKASTFGIVIYIWKMDEIVFPLYVILRYLYADTFVEVANSHTSRTICTYIAPVAINLS